MIDGLLQQNIMIWGFFLLW